jgi:hypothetical protein
VHGFAERLEVSVAGDRIRATQEFWVFGLTFLTLTYTIGPKASTVD